MKINRCIALLLLCCVLINSGCTGGSGDPGGSGDTGGSVVISGVLGDEFDTSGLIAGIGPESRSISSAVTHIGSFKVIAGQLRDMELIEVEDDASFSVEIEKNEEADHVLMLLNENSESDWNRVEGFVAIPSTGNTLINMPVNQIDGELNLGTLSGENDEALSDRDVSEINTIDSGQLVHIQETAVSDNLLKTIQNSYENEGYQFAAIYMWRNSLTSCINRWFEPELLKSYDGWVLRIGSYNYNHQYSLDDELELYPPEEITMVKGSGSEIWDYEYYGPDYPVIGPVPDTPSPWERNFYLSIWPDEQQSSLNLGFGPGGGGFQYFGFIQSKVPAGDWYLKLTGASEYLAVFDLAPSAAVQGDNPIIYLPSVYLETAAGIIDNLRIRFFLYEDGIPVEVDRLSDCLDRFDDFRIRMNGNPDIIYVNENIISGDSIIVDLSDFSMELENGSIEMWYELYGESFNFVWSTGIPDSQGGMGVIRDFSSGMYHTLFLDVQGDVYSINGDGTGVEDNTPFARVIPFDSEVVKVGTGQNLSLALCEDTSLWVWGSLRDVDTSIINQETSLVPVSIMTGVTDILENTGSDLYIEKTDGNIFSIYDMDKTIAASGVKELAVSSGTENYISFILYDDNSLYGMGENLYRELGLEDNNERTEYTFVADNVTRVVLADYPYILKTDGSVWRFGNNEAPVKVMDNATDISSGNKHLLILSDTGILYSMGQNYHGQVGTGSEDNINYSEPQEIMTGVRLINAAYNQSFAVKTDDTLWAWGENYADNLGFSEPDEVLSPTLVEY